MTTKNRSHPPEHYAELREVDKDAGIRSLRVKVLTDDYGNAKALMEPFVQKAKAARKQVTDAIRAREREKGRK